MLTLKSILPKLKRNERITSHNETENNYVRFTVQFSRFRYQKHSFDVYVSADDKYVSIRYHHNTEETWALNCLDNFMERLKQSVKTHPDFRLRMVTGAMKLSVEGHVDEDMRDDYVDIHEMSAFFIALLFGVSSVFEIFSLINLTLLGFQVSIGLVFLMFLYAQVSVWFEGKEDAKDKTFWLFFGFSFLMVIALTLLLSAGLFVALCVSWILPWGLTFSAFLISFFGYHWAVKVIRKLSEMDKKYSSKA